jgi:hypothetical protein
MDSCCLAKGWRKAYLQIYGSLFLADLELWHGIIFSWWGFETGLLRACRGGNYIAFFRLARKATYLQACLMHAHFSKVGLCGFKHFRFCKTWNSHKWLLYVLEGFVAWMSFSWFKWWVKMVSSIGMLKKKASYSKFVLFWTRGFHSKERYLFSISAMVNTMVGCWQRHVYVHHCCSSCSSVLFLVFIFYSL